MDAFGTSEKMKSKYDTNYYKQNIKSDNSAAWKSDLRLKSTNKTLSQNSKQGMH